MRFAWVRKSMDYSCKIFALFGQKKKRIDHEVKRIDRATIQGVRDHIDSTNARNRGGIEMARTFVFIFLFLNADHSTPYY